MYLAVVIAADALKKLKITYPECLLKIVDVTDGENTGSHHSVEKTTNLLVESKIVIAVGANCKGLKTLSIASGGKCYLKRNLKESLKLFEQETVLSVQARKVDQSYEKLSIEERLAKAKSIPFDLSNTVHEFKLPESNGGGLSAKGMEKKLQSQEESNKSNKLANSSLKRIGKEIQHYSQNPAYLCCHLPVLQYQPLEDPAPRTQGNPIRERPLPPLRTVPRQLSLQSPRSQIHHSHLPLQHELTGQDLPLSLRLQRQPC